MAYGMQDIYDVFPQSYNGGLRLYPVGGVLTEPTMTATAATVNLQVAFAGATTVRLNGQVVTVPTITNKTMVGTAGAAIAGGKYEAYVLATPRYSVPFMTTIPTDATFNTAVGRAAVNGDRVLVGVSVSDLSANIFRKLYKRLAGVWTEADITFEPPEYNHMSLPCGKVENMDVIISKGIRDGDLPVFYGSNRFVNSVEESGRALLRAPSSFPLARVEYTLDGTNNVVAPVLFRMNNRLPG